MTTDQEIKERKALEERLDIQLRIVRAQIDKILAGVLQNKKSDYRKMSIDYYMQQLENVRHIINPEKRISQYQDLINGLLNNPQRNITGFTMLEPQWKAFKFSDAEKIIFQDCVVQLQTIQHDLNVKQTVVQSPEPSRKSVVDKPASIIKSASENSKAQNSTIDFHKYIQQLEKVEESLEKSNQSAIKSMYKRVKKKALITLGKQNVTKLDMVWQLKSELNNLYNATQNKEMPLSQVKVALKLQDSLARIMQLNVNRLSLVSDRNSPFYNIIDSLKAEVAKTTPAILCSQLLQDYANTKFGAARTHFGEYIDIIKSDPKYVGLNDKTNDLNFKTGDYLNLVYPLPTEDRDQLTIDSFGKFISKSENKETELYAIYLIMSEVKSISVLVDRANTAIQKYGDEPELLNDVLDSFVVQINEKCTLLKDFKTGPLAKIVDTETKSQLESLVTSIDISVDEIRNKQSKSNRPEA